MALCSVVRVESGLLSSVAPASLYLCQDAAFLLLPVGPQSFCKTPQLGLAPRPLHQQCSRWCLCPVPALHPFCPSPDVGEEGVDVPGEHSDHVGDDEGGGGPGHQEEGDEGHSPQEAQHLDARSALHSAGGPGAGLLRGAGAATCQPARRRPRRGQPLPSGREAPRRRRQAQPGRRGSEEAADGKAAGQGGWGASGPGLLRNE